jgi:hypothetical protein
LQKIIQKIENPNSLYHFQRIPEEDDIILSNISGKICQCYTTNFILENKTWKKLPNSLHESRISLTSRSDPYIYKKVSFWVWWFMPIIPTRERLRQEVYEFKVSLGYITIPYLIKIIESIKKEHYKIPQEQRKNYLIVRS